MIIIYIHSKVISTEVQRSGEISTNKKGLDFSTALEVTKKRSPLGDRMYTLDFMFVFFLLLSLMFVVDKSYEFYDDIKAFF